MASVRMGMPVNWASPSRHPETCGCSWSLGHPSAVLQHTYWHSPGFKRGQGPEVCVVFDGALQIICTANKTATKAPHHQNACPTLTHLQPQVHNPTLTAARRVLLHVASLLATLFCREDTSATPIAITVVHCCRT